MRYQGVVDLERKDGVPSALDDLLLTPNDIKLAVFIDVKWMEEPTASADNAPAIRPCTWCNGIGVKQMSSGTSSNTEAIATVAVMTLAWLSPTSLGSAVVPDVRISMAGASSPF